MKTIFIGTVCFVLGYTIAFWYNDFTVVTLGYTKTLHACDCYVTNRQMATVPSETFMEITCYENISLREIIGVCKQ